MQGCTAHTDLNMNEGASLKRFRSIESVAQRKLQMLDDAVELKDLRSSPGSRLEGVRIWPV